MAVVIDSGASIVVVAGEAVPGTPMAGTVLSGEGLWGIAICDDLGAPIVDVTTVAFGLTLFKGLNQPASVRFRVPSWHPFVSTNHSDGNPYIEAGIRTAKLYRRDTPGSGWQIVFNGFVWHLEDEGDEDETWTQVTCYDPMILWRYRPVRGFDYSRKTKNLSYNGNLITPKFAKPQGYISAPQILRQVLDHSQSEELGGPGGDNPLGEGPLYVSLSGGTIDEGGANAIAVQPTDSPSTIAELHKQLTDTVWLDVWIDPIDQAGSRIMGNVNAVERAGVDKPWLHLQYGTGDYSVKTIKRERDMDLLANKIWYLLGPRLQPDGTRWQGNVTIDGMPSGTKKDIGIPLPNVPAGYRAAVENRVTNSRAKYPIMMSISIYDSHQEYLDHDIYGGMWQMESYLRAEPREMLYVTPTRNGPYDLFDLHIGDTIRVSAFDGIRRGFSNVVQRVFGYTILIDEDMVEAITELETSPNTS